MREKPPAGVDRRFERHLVTQWKLGDRIVESRRARPKDVLRAPPSFLRWNNGGRATIFCDASPPLDKSGALQAVQKPHHAGMRQPQRALKHTNVFVRMIANGDQRRAGVRASGQVARSALDRICDG